MRVLLDSHFVLWLHADQARVDGVTRQRLLAAEQIFVSPASIWELSIKQSHGKLDVDVAGLVRASDRRGWLELPITHRHGAIAGALPHHHRDPFDRMLVAQALAEGLSLLTADKQLRDYWPHVRML